MKIQVTAGEVLDSRLVEAWDKLMERDKIFTITLEEAKKLGLID